MNKDNLSLAMNKIIAKTIEETNAITVVDTIQDRNIEALKVLALSTIGWIDVIDNLYGKDFDEDQEMLLVDMRKSLDRMIEHDYSI